MLQNRTRGWLRATLALFIAAATLPFSSVAGAQGPPSVQVEPLAAGPGETVTLRGTGWPSGASISSLSYEAAGVGGPSAALGGSGGTFTADSTGAFSVQGTVPPTLFGASTPLNLHTVPGPYVIVVRSGNDLRASTPFTVMAPRQGGLLWGDIFRDMNASGTHDQADDQSEWGVALTLTGPTAASVPQEGVSDAHGRYVFLLPAGTYSLRAQDPGQGVPWASNMSGTVVAQQSLKMDLLLARNAAIAPAVAHDGRYFGETGFRIDNDQVWQYFSARGGLDIFGYPVSRSFILLGCTVQVFQRQIAQTCGGGPVALMNVLDELFPFTRVNFATFPEVNGPMKAGTPGVDEPQYDQRVLEYVRANAPDAYAGQTVNFEATFFGLITPQMAGTSDAGLLAMTNLEVWGAPISAPMSDPGNADFIYQRFQRGIMHYISSQHSTRGVLLADYVKQMMKDSPQLPIDLREQARGNRMFDQYCPTSPSWLCRPNELPATDLTYAFEIS